MNCFVGSSLTLGIYLKGPGGHWSVTDCAATLSPLEFVEALFLLSISKILILKALRYIELPCGFLTVFLRVASAFFGF